MKLPPKSDGTYISLPPSKRQVTIIGANGSGKTRFTEYLRRNESSPTFNLSALEALCTTSHDDADPCSIDSLYARSMAKANFLHNDADTMFERLMVLLLNEEMVRLVEYKVSHARGENPPLTETKLDAVISHWQEIFPENHVLREGGGLLFGRIGDKSSYAPGRLSQGEKAVLYYFGAVLYAPDNATVFVDNPGMFLHNSLLRRLWDEIEAMRPDCRFVYTTHDIDFASSRAENVIVWVRSFNPDNETWDYDLLPEHTGLSEEVYMALMGTRRPVMFIEGDATHSIDGKLYPLIFKDYTVKSLGSCNKVIEATRAFNDLRAFHHLESRGIVDRDRRDEKEVKYLRGKNIFVPEVAEIENILMLENVVKAVARFHRKDPDRVFNSVKKSVLHQFRHDLRQQALLHTRHRVKRTVEYRIDGRFTNINALEEHMVNLVVEINPRGLYENFCRDFSRMVQLEDYAGVLKVYNQKSMVPNSNVGSMCGVGGSKDAYSGAIISILKTECREADSIRKAIAECFGLG